MNVMSIHVSFLFSRWTPQRYRISRSYIKTTIWTWASIKNLPQTWRRYVM